MSAELVLDLPWIAGSEPRLDEVTVRRGVENSLEYDDGIVLDVRVIDPQGHTSVNALVDEVKSSGGPGRVVLVAGAVPLEWRAGLREAGVSFFDLSGVAEINWPRLHVSAKRFGQAVKRHRTPLPLQKGHGLVAQELLAVTSDGARPTIGELAKGAAVSLPTASKAISQLAEHGLVLKHRDGTRVSVEVVDRVAIAQRLAERTAWPGTETISAYGWGRSVFHVAARVSEAASWAEVSLAVTGRVGAAYLGVLGTSSPDEVRCWVDDDDRRLVDIAEALGLEPAPEEVANVTLSIDTWGSGTHRRQEHQFDEFSAWIAHPLRVWCDLHDERRGTEFAAQLWGAVAHGG